MDRKKTSVIDYPRLLFRRCASSTQKFRDTRECANVSGNRRRSRMQIASYDFNSDGKGMAPVELMIVA